MYIYCTGLKNTYKLITLINIDVIGFEPCPIKLLLKIPIYLLNSLAIDAIVSFVR